jgi:hypothetical protein
MLRPIAFAAALLVALPHAARAQWSDDDQPRAAVDDSPRAAVNDPGAAEDDGIWNDGQWSGDDQLSDLNGPPSAGDPADGYAPPNGPASREAYAPPPPSSPDMGAPPPEPGYTEAAAVEQTGPSMQDFRSGLSGYGRWVETPEYGMVWQPETVSYGWRPYWDGHWVYTSAGWTWVTDEPWGWATYHYGRWAYLGSRGWAWLPGRVWAPAWVAWRMGEGVAGWCPLGPRGVVYSEPHYWIFVRSRRFLEPVRRVALPYAQIRVWYTRARPLPMYRPGPRWGPPTHVVEVETHRPIRAVPIVEAHRPGVRAVAGGVQVFRPHTQPIVYRRDVAQPERGVRPVVTPVLRPGGAPKPLDDHRAQPMLAPRESGDHRPQAQPAPHDWGDHRPQAQPAPHDWGDHRPEAQPAPHDMGDHRSQPPAREPGDRHADAQPVPRQLGDHHPQRPAEAAPAPRGNPAEWGGPMREGPAHRAEPARPATPARPAEKEPAHPAAPAEPRQHAAQPAAAAAHAERAQPAVARFESRGGAAPRPAAAPHSAPAARPVEKKKQ